MERILGREGALVTVNSQLNPIMRIQRDGWLRLRFLNASVSRFFRLRLEEHSLYLIAVDGGALPSPEEREEVLLAPGERVEVMIRGSRPQGSYNLVSLPYSRDAMLMAGNRGTASGPLLLATLLYEGQAEQTWSLPERLVSVDVLPEPSVRRGFQLGQGMGMGMAFTINGRTFNPDRIDTRVGLNAVEEWEFINPTTIWRTRPRPCGLPRLHGICHVSLPHPGARRLGHDGSAGDPSLTPMTECLNLLEELSRGCNQIGTASSGPSKTAGPLSPWGGLEPGLHIHA